MCNLFVFNLCGNSFISGPLCNFLLGEGKLELFLEEYPPLESNINKAKIGLSDAKKCLLVAAGELGVKVSYCRTYCHLLIATIF